MSDFRPASEQELSGAGYGVAIDPALAKSVVGIFGDIATSAITAGAAGKQAKTQQAHEKSLAKDAQTLEKLRARTVAAQSTVSSAEATVQSLSTTKTLYIVGGSVAAVLVLSLTGYFLFRKPKKRKQRAAEEEEE